jgi:aminoglycoside phosphotransferase (APT) family kinase protein
MSGLFPEARRAAVERALTAAFSTTEIDGATPLSGGLSGAGIWKVRVGGIAYLLRVETPAHVFGDATRGYPAMRIAAEAFLAPRLRYASAEDGVAIMDLIETRSLAFDYPGDGGPLAVEVAQTLRVLHEGAAFPDRGDYLANLGQLIAAFPQVRLLEPAATQEVLARFEAVRTGYRPRAEDRVSIHADLSPANLLYDGRRIWLIDWELASYGDRYVDLASAVAWFGGDPRREDLILATYFGRAPTAEERARLLLMRIAGDVFYGLVWLISAAVQRPGTELADRKLAGPPLGDLHADILTGERSFDDWDTRVAMAKGRLRAALEALRSPACGEALALIGAALAA